MKIKIDSVSKFLLTDAPPSGCRYQDGNQDIYSDHCRVGVVYLHLEHKSQVLEGLTASIKGVQEAASCALHGSRSRGG